MKVRYRAKGSSCFSRRIARINSDGTLDVTTATAKRRLRTGKSTSDLSRSHAVDVFASEIGRHEDRGSGSDGAQLMKGDKVEASFQGWERYYQVYISRGKFDRTFNLDSKNGEKKRGVARGIV